MAGIGTDGSLWGPILEKAFAKYHGNYSHTESGFSGTALKTLYGAPVFEMIHKSYTADKLWKALQASDTNGDVITAGTHETDAGSHWERQANGLANNHAYTILGVKEVTDASGNKIRLVKVRDPYRWLSGEYTGDFSDKSKKWTPDLRKQAGSVIKDDGEFFIPLADYMKSFAETYINYNTKNMSRTHFLVLDDNNTNTRPYYTCNNKCSFHKFTIKSKKT